MSEHTQPTPTAEVLPATLIEVPDLTYSMNDFHAAGETTRVATLRRHGSRVATVVNDPQEDYFQALFVCDADEGEFNAWVDRWTGTSPRDGQPYETTGVLLALADESKIRATFDRRSRDSILFLPEGAHPITGTRQIRMLPTPEIIARIAQDHGPGTRWWDRTVSRWVPIGSPTT
ncbi:hypothetical protein D1871_04510 [Nakamurella silvestris]|nr:hypothetical protein D1871_04510 [Nakamurella silvestris]